MSARFHYCSSLEFDTLRSGFAERSSVLGTSGPYSLASLYTSYTLQVANDEGFKGTKAESRSVGIDLSGVTKVHIGMWVKSNGRIGDPATSCEIFGPEP